MTHFPPSWLHWSRLDGPGGPLITAAGELDLVSAPPLRAAALLACAECPPGGRVTLDLTAVDFMDSQGQQVLLSCARALPGRVSVRVARGGQPARVLALTGTRAILDVTEVDAPGGAD